MAIKPSDIFYYTIQARGYELDSYDHVNNAVYLNYAEQARWELFRETGFLKQLKDSGNKMVVTGLEIRYMREINLFDEIMIETKVKRERPYLVFHHRMINNKNKLPVARLRVKVILLNKNKIPCDIPLEMVED